MYSKERIEYFRKELNIPDEVLMVNNGSWGPVSKASLNAYVNALYRDCQVNRVLKPSGIMSSMFDYLAEDRKEVALFLNCDPEEVALTESTTSGFCLALWGLDLHPGDEIISTNLENGAGYGAIKTIAARKDLKVNYVDLGRVGEKDAVAAISAAITPDTKVVAISHVTYVSGVALDVKEISRICRERGILTVIDGVQAAGTMKIDVRDIGCDAYCIARHKFLCGPDGAGAVYFRRESLENFQPTYAGVFNDHYHGFKEYAPNLSGDRFDCTTRPYPAQAAAAAAMRWRRTEVGDEMYEQMHVLRAMLFDLLEKIPGVEVLSIRKYSEQSALLTFKVSNMSGGELSQFLNDRYVGNRTVEHWYGPAFRDEDMFCGGIRLSVSFWNTPEDMEKVAELVAQAARS